MSASPNPVPPYFLVEEPSPWLKPSKIASIFSGGIPTPVSETVKWRRTDESVASSTVTPMDILPSSVNFTALLPKLSKICPQAVGVPRQMSRDFRPEIKDEIQPFLPRFECQFIRNILQDQVKIKRFLFKSDLIGMGLGKIQDIVQDFKERKPLI